MYTILSTKIKSLEIKALYGISAKVQELMLIVMLVPPLIWNEGTIPFLLFWYFAFGNWSFVGSGDSGYDVYLSGFVTSLVLHLGLFNTSKINCFSLANALLQAHNKLFIYLSIKKTSSQGQL